MKAGGPCDRHLLPYEHDPEHWHRKVSDVVRELRPVLERHYGGGSYEEPEALVLRRCDRLACSLTDLLIGAGDWLDEDVLAALGVTVTELSWFVGDVVDGVYEHTLERHSSGEFRALVRRLAAVVLELWRVRALSSAVSAAALARLQRSPSQHEHLACLAARRAPRTQRHRPLRHMAAHAVRTTAGEDAPALPSSLTIRATAPAARCPVSLGGATA